MFTDAPKQSATFAVATMHRSHDTFRTISRRALAHGFAFGRRILSCPRGLIPIRVSAQRVANQKLTNDLPQARQSKRRRIKPHHKKEI